MKPFSTTKNLAPLCCLVLLLGQMTIAAQSTLKNISKQDASTGWIYFDPGVQMTPESFFPLYSTELGMNNTDQFIQVRTWTDDLGMTHRLYHQYHEGVRVDGGNVLLHEAAGSLKCASAEAIPGIKMGAHPAIDEKTAVRLAKDAVKAKVYAWENPELIANLEARHESLELTRPPIAELQYVRIDLSAPFVSNNMVLAFRTFIYATDPFEMADVFVDARTGQFLYKLSRVIECVPGTGVTSYYGTQNIQVEPSGADFKLFDNCRGLGVNTLSNTGTDIINSSTNFTALTQNQNSGHWCAENTYDYFLNAHGRNSYNGAGAIMNTRVGGYGANAFWNGSFVTILNGDGGSYSNSLATLDVVGHEWAHAVTQFNGTGGLIYSYEPGALNESFSDIFGTMVEYYAPGGYGDYFIGDECWVPGGMLRNMMDPKSKGQPDTYLGMFWWTSSGDNGGVHTNSGVPNHWFYLLAEGSGATDGVNDNGDVFTVSGIGRAKAAAIAYRTLTTYLTPSSNFFSARAGSIQAAKDLYGATSNEVCQVANAWYAVGVGKDNLMIKDNLADTGVEPSNGIDMYLSYDIWVRKTPDVYNYVSGHYLNEHNSQDLMATVGPNPSYVYVKIRNIGDVASECGKLKMYWSRASTGLSWPINWINYLCPGGGGAICGDQFTTCFGTSPVDYDIPSIPAGGDFTLQIVWCPPDPTFLPGTGNPSEDRHFCLLARIIRDNDPMHDEQTNISCNFNTWQNNNIGWKNIRVEPSNGVYIANPTGLYVRTRRIIANNQVIKFQINDNVQNPFRTKGDIFVLLPDSLFNQWVQGGMLGSGFQQIAPKTLRLTESKAVIDGIRLNAGQDYSIGLAFNPFEGQPITVPGKYLVTMQQLEKANETAAYQVVGGEGFEYQVNPFPIWLGNDITLCKGDSIVLTADLSNWNQNDSTVVFWSNGQTGTSIQLAPSSSQLLKATVTNGSGLEATDEVMITVQTPVKWYRDLDGDGYGTDFFKMACAAPEGYVDNFRDCNDYNNDIHPGALEICNGVDDNCNGATDEGLIIVQTWRDLDADGYGDPLVSYTGCTIPQGYVMDGTDCDDQNPKIHPNATEFCNNIDDDCDMQIDENCIVSGLNNTLDALGNLQIYPNPTTGVFTLELSEPAIKGMSMRLFGIVGPVLFEQTLVPGNYLQLVQTSDLPAGIYFVQVVVEGKVFALRKLVKN